MSDTHSLAPSEASEHWQCTNACYHKATASTERSDRQRRKHGSLFTRHRPDDDEIWKGYERIVGFDTMRDAGDTASRSSSYTLQAKSVGYARTKHTRTFMCAVDATESSEHALEWIMENLVDDGDEIVAVRVLGSEQDGMWAANGLPGEMDQIKARDGAHSLLTSIVELNESTVDETRRICISVEFITGSIKSSIIHLVTIYRPESLTIGTRGKQVSALQKILGSTPLGNLSKSLIWQSPVPVIIVRPEDRVMKHLSKRMANPRRHEYYDLMQREHTLPMSLPPPGHR
ncbi:hypothetical protein MSPP1_000330 [Malassezia sp. CBS 17886]|nr:hypothetical protein MSPP1_000330 [Malassezia sp. CBS 17886]